MPQQRLAIACGSTVNTNNQSKKKKKDAFAILLSLHGAATAAAPSPIHWKTRLPAAASSSSGLVISPCGLYAVGGTSGGIIYVWSTVGGELKRTFKAHYRAVTRCLWVGNGRQLVSGGDDGLVHVWATMDLVSQDNNNNNVDDDIIRPSHTFTNHVLAVTDIVMISETRLASASEDGQVLIFELTGTSAGGGGGAGDSVLATLQFPTAIRTLAVDDPNNEYSHSNNRIFCGGSNGTIFLVDLDEYAAHQTEKKLGIVMVQNSRSSNTVSAATKRAKRSISHVEQVFGSGERTAAAVGEQQQPSSSSPSFSFQELSGHNSSIASMAVLPSQADNSNNNSSGMDGSSTLLISGDAAGVLRVWDVASRTCVRVMCPFATASAAATATPGSQPPSPSQTTKMNHPITSIAVLQESPEELRIAAAKEEGGVKPSGLFSGRRRHNRNTGVSKTTDSVVQLIKPLQTFFRADNINEKNHAVLSVPFLHARANHIRGSDDASLSFWDVTMDNFDYRQALRKRRRLALSSKSSRQNNDAVDTNTEMARLRKELEDAKSTIEQMKRRTSSTS